ncbi:N-6 DNA methylase (plasmid) [Sphingomonas sp. AP4-R1]|uniref:N-6 DNA methylase n=1 Tax=Sphingomonas sp. AP4-R1 TaxID=2735134 RepID=UPI001493D0D2|nr:N-6 DNA methylase [Sphingomonas sp. AP4-R1]QJU60942.1 N-6 DNA methylase [Sphingomonas sp. AP4-R1]
MTVRLSQKEAGAYYTPNMVVAALVSWAVRRDGDRMLDPSCGDGRFLVEHSNSVGIEQDPVSAHVAIDRAPGALVHEGDFFQWAEATAERFECAAGNPPFIRYQTFKGAVRARALAFCSAHGAMFNGLASSWAPFLVATAALLKPGGRMAFVVPAEIGHAPYASPLIEYLVAHFKRVQIVAVREKLFPDLSEDCWLLYAEGFGGKTDHIAFTVCDRFEWSTRPPKQAEKVAVGEWRDSWNRRLRPYLLPAAIRDAYRAFADDVGGHRLSSFASVGIGYVSGDNRFFHLRPSEAQRWKIPASHLHPTVRTGRMLAQRAITPTTVAAWQRADEPVMLLRLQRGQELSASVRRYLDSSAGQEARQGYKCRNRDPWYAVPDVQVPDFFMSYMSGRSASLVQNTAGATCTNTVHSVRVRDRALAAKLLPSWGTPLSQLSCELEGHPLGGGMLKLEPREAGRLLFTPPPLAKKVNMPILEEGISIMQRWRHYGG